IEVLEPVSIRDNACIEKLRGLNPDFMAVVAYGRILPPAILDLPTKGCVNLHASLLPKYRGAAPINWAIVNNEKVTGVTTMLMDKGMDTGPMLLKEEVGIGEDETAEELAKKLSNAGASLLAKTIDLLSEDKIKPAPQDETEASYAPMLKKEDGRIDWKKSAEEIKNLMRGLYPWPGAYTALNGQLKIHSGRVIDTNSHEAEPGTIVGVSREGIRVACGKGVFEITELQPENRKKLPAGDFIQGYRVGVGERFDG
ncbi:MAG: methionyl-tRNA formyltransferase, partial [Deltaproteobacteria bacterium]|nr:methionyl-tRNA formyltransferase [Deltaproteobacteria bacterium]